MEFCIPLIAQRLECPARRMAGCLLKLTWPCLAHASPAQASPEVRTSISLPNNFINIIHGVSWLWTWQSSAECAPAQFSQPPRLFFVSRPPLSIASWTCGLCICVLAVVFWLFGFDRGESFPSLLIVHWSHSSLSGSLPLSKPRMRK